MRCKAEGCDAELATMASQAAQRCARCVAKERDRRKLRNAAFTEAQRQAYEVDVPRLERLVESQKEVIEQLQEELRASPVGDGEYKALYEEALVREHETVEKSKNSRVLLLEANRNLTKRINAMRQAHAATCERFRVEVEVAQRQRVKAELTRDKALDRVKAMARPQELLIEPTQEQPERHLWNALFMHSMQHAKVQHNPDVSPADSMRAMVRACCESAERLYNYVKEARQHGTDNHHNGQGGQRSAGAPAEPAASERPRGESATDEAAGTARVGTAPVHAQAFVTRGRNGQDLAREQEAVPGLPGEDEVDGEHCGASKIGEHDWLQGGPTTADGLQCNLCGQRRAL